MPDHLRYNNIATIAIYTFLSRGGIANTFLTVTTPEWLEEWQDCFNPYGKPFPVLCILLIADHVHKSCGFLNLKLMDYLFTIFIYETVKYSLTLMSLTMQDVKSIPGWSEFAGPSSFKPKADHKSFFRNKRPFLRSVLKTSSGKT